MSLNDFIENVNGLDVVALQSNELRQISGGIGKPVVSSALTSYKVTPEDAYIFWYYEEVSE